MLKFNLLLSSTERSICYLNTLIENNFKPDFVIFFSKKQNNKRILDKLENKKIKYSHLKTDQINNTIVEKEIINTKNEIFIYSGYTGQIIKSKKILNKTILHAHPGSLYDFKGSTTMYYSLFLKKKIFCSILRLNEKIDSGNVFFRKKIALPKNIKINEFESDFDSNVRANTIVEFLKLYNKKKLKIKRKYYLKSNNSSYYIIHPIIRGIAFNKKFY